MSEIIIVQRQQRLIVDPPSKTVSIVPAGNVTTEAMNAAIATALASMVQTGVYTPTLTGMVIGTSGTPMNTARFVYIGGSKVGDFGILDITGYIKFGTTGCTFPTTPTFSLPPGFNFTADTVANITPVGPVVINDVGTIQMDGSLTRALVNTVNIQVFQTSTNYANRANLTPTVPHTWAINDELCYNMHAPVVRV